MIAPGVALAMSSVVSITAAMTCTAFPLSVAAVIFSVPESVSAAGVSTVALTSFSVVAAFFVANSVRAAGFITATFAVASFTPNIFIAAISAPTLLTTSDPISATLATPIAASIEIGLLSAAPGVSPTQTGLLAAP
jgi:hypothetical protein